MIFWGITFVVYKFAIVSFDPFSIIFIRLLISIVFLFSYAALSKRMMKIRKEDWKWFMLLALFEPFIYFIGEVYGITMVTSTMAAIIIATIPLVVPVAAYIFLRERLNRTNIIGLAISFVGVLLVVLASEGKLLGNIKGILLMFLAVFGAVGYTILAKKLIHTYNGIMITAWQSTFGAVMVLPFFLLIDLPSLDVNAIAAESLWAILYLGVFGSSICFILFIIAIRELGASKANVFANLVPVVAAFVSFLVLDEQMPLLKIAGIAVVLAGLFLSQYSREGYRNGVKRWRKFFSMPRI
jgi:drug/metabolite transporter (DMT)-like permease